MSKLDKDAVIAKFTEAYTAVNGTTPVIEAKGGWYSVDGGKNVRLAQLDEMADTLTNGASSAEAQTAPAKKSTPKKAAATTSKPSKKKTGFSVKDFWQNQVLANFPGSKAPR